jgi:hypothetical protein
MTQPAKRIPTDDRRAGDRHIASDYWNRDRHRDCSLATDLNGLVSTVTRPASRAVRCCPNRLGQPRSAYRRTAGRSGVGLDMGQATNDGPPQ